MTFFEVSLSYNSSSVTVQQGGRSMTVIYIDLVFLLNFTANYLLLLGAGRLAGTVLLRRRIALGAAAGAGYAVLVFVPGFAWLAGWPCKIAVGALLTLIAFGPVRRYIQVTVLFFAASAGLAGAALAAQNYGGAGLLLENGVLYSSFDLRLLLLLFVGCYFIMSLFFRRIGRHTGGELVELEIELKQGKLSLTALNDSGHTLTDPIHNRPVVVTDIDHLRRFLPEGIQASDPTSGLRKCMEAGIQARLVPYKAVGVECGLLLAICTQSVCAAGKPLGPLLIAAAPTPVDDGGRYQALIGGI